MSTLTGEEHSVVLRSEKDLEGYFHAFAKPRECIRVGIEAEFFAVQKETGQAISYEGGGGIQELLKALARHFAYEPLREDGNIIALKRGDNLITLEPGGQMELSAPPVVNAFEIEEQIRIFLTELKVLQKDFPEVTWIASGFHPFSKFEETAWVPKKRYQIMAEHFKTHGTLSHEMMRQTATNQINVDYTSEANAMASLRVALGITSIVSALFGNSAFSLGRPNGFKVYRLEVWNHTDPSRSGLIVEFTRPERTFRDYLNYLLEMPLIFIVRQGRWIPVRNLSFRHFIKEGYQGIRATLGDFELHLSTAFPEVRLKQYLEIRGADCQRPELIPSVAAVWKGILYDAEVRERAWDLVAFASEADRLNLHFSIAKQGLRASLGLKPILPIAQELVELACMGLGKQKRGPNSKDECVFIERIRRLIQKGKSPAEILLEEWKRKLKKDPRQLIQKLSII